MRWDGNHLSGRSRLVGGESYNLYITEPEGYMLEEVRCTGAAVERTEDGSQVGLRKITLKSAEGRAAAWTAIFSHDGKRD